MEYGDITKQDEAVIAPANKTGTISIDLNSGVDIVVTGVGFRPTWVWFAYLIGNTVGAGGIGVAGSPGLANGMSLHPFENTGANFWGVDAYSLYLDTPSGDTFRYVSSMDIDGFTLNNDGSLFAGTMNVRFIAFK